MPLYYHIPCPEAAAVQMHSLPLDDTLKEVCALNTF